jgi:lysophospholipase L1-like esterase
VHQKARRKPSRSTPELEDGSRFFESCVRDKIAEVNRIVAKLDDQQHVFYMDIGRKFLDDKGAFLADSFRLDNLHPQARGYDIWGEAVSAKLAELLE